MDTVRSALDLLPRLQAEESMREATRVAMGAATLKVEDRRDVMGDWEDAARNPNKVLTPAPAAKQAPRAIEDFIGPGMAIVFEPATLAKESGTVHHGE